MQMICGNTQAEVERDIHVKHAFDNSIRSQEIYGRNDVTSAPIAMNEISERKAEYDSVLNRLMAGEIVTDSKGINHWLPAAINKLAWAKTLRKQMGDKGHSLLYAYKNGDLDEGYMKMIREEAAILAYTVVRHD